MTKVTSEVRPNPECFADNFRTGLPGAADYQWWAVRQPCNLRQSNRSDVTLKREPNSCYADGVAERQVPGWVVLLCPVGRAEVGTARGAHAHRLTRLWQ